jgi:hypothetical protein
MGFDHAADLFRIVFSRKCDEGNKRPEEATPELDIVVPAKAGVQRKTGFPRSRE